MDSFPSRLGRLEIALSAKKTALKTSPKLPIQTIESSGGDQSASPFIHKIPYDIRSQIYQQLLLSISPELHINYLTPRKCQPCILSKSGYIPPPYKRPLYFSGDAWGVMHSQCYVQATAEGEDSDLRDVLNLARSCWVLYHELTHLIYTHFRFHLINIHSSHHFLTHTPPQSLAQIRSLHLSWLIILPLSQSNPSFNSDSNVFNHDQFSFLPKHGSRKQQVSHFKTHQAMHAKQKEICKYLNTSTLANLSSLKIFIYQDDDQLHRNVEIQQVREMLEGITIRPAVFEVQLPPWKVERSYMGLGDGMGSESIGEDETGVRIERRNVLEEGFAIGYVRVERGGRHPGLWYHGCCCPLRVVSGCVRRCRVSAEEKGWI